MSLIRAIQKIEQARRELFSEEDKLRASEGVPQDEKQKYEKLVLKANESLGLFEGVLRKLNSEVQKIYEDYDIK